MILFNSVIDELSLQEYDDRWHTHHLNSVDPLLHSCLMSILLKKRESKNSSTSDRISLKRGATTLVSLSQANAYPLIRTSSIYWHKNIHPARLPASTSHSLALSIWIQQKERSPAQADELINFMSAKRQELGTSYNNRFLLRIYLVTLSMLRANTLQSNSVLQIRILSLNNSHLIIRIHFVRSWRNMHW